MSAAPARSVVRSTARGATAPARDLSRAGAARERALRIVAPARARARRAPFVVVVVTVLSVGLVGLVVLSTVLQNQAFELARLQQESSSLTVQQQQLQYEADRQASPASLAAAASGIGMIPNQTPVFLKPDTGEIIGVPTPAGSQP
ncbi:MAG: hypothetical protein P1U38_01540 [Aeromicrobium sp.]|mgnify:CR=1 FL=1|uniref:hypothetical protein n=1 Tax=Aeromicrobium sp. TaxID=1871063 RepID=UPI0025B82624|nr:hypothetical protein [Aeromicrobium sp.]MCK5890593.1 hypothetical protein [Aeromicrobium sp.]MDF1703438.1 hypothetical protein [Aeromicrobium sp.]